MDENEISRSIIGCAIEVHRQLGPGLQLVDGVSRVVSNFNEDTN